MTTHRIYVYGEDCNVTLEKPSKTTWVAAGLCRGKYVEQVAPSQKRALDGWKYRAELANEYEGMGKDEPEPSERPGPQDSGKSVQHD